MKRIVLVYPRFQYPSGDIPYGIAQVASYLRQGLDAEVLVWDATFHPSHRAFEEFLARTRPVAVGIGVNTVMFRDALRIAAAARERGAFVFAGGPHATVLPESLMASENIDAVVMGEGEETTLELMRNFLDGGHRETAGAWIKQGDAVLQGPPRGFIADLDRLPDPAWDLLPMRDYMRAWYQLDAYDPGLEGTGLIASRGCPFHCSFCQPTLEKLFGSRVRFRSPQRIISELSTLVSTYGVRGFWFFDDSFTASKKWLLDFCATLKASGLGLPWGCTTRANLVDEESMTAMAEAGLVRMGIGIESAHARILEGVYRKGIRVDDAVSTLRLARKHRVKTLVFFMLGAPGETREELLGTVDFAASLDADDCSFSLFVPLPGTAIHDEMVAQGCDLSPCFDDYEYYSRQPFRGEVPVEELRRIQRQGFFKFYTRRRRWGVVSRFLASRKGLRSLLLKVKRLL